MCFNVRYYSYSRAIDTLLLINETSLRLAIVSSDFQHRLLLALITVLPEFLSKEKLDKIKKKLTCMECQKKLIVFK